MKIRKQILCVILAVLCMCSSFCFFASAEETLPCDHEYTSSVVAPACADQGYTLYVCTKCGSNYKINYTAALGHDYGSWELETEATCQHEGLMKRCCSRCESYETKTLGVTDHVDLDQNHICDVCQAEISELNPFSPYDWFVAFFQFLKQWFLGIFA